MSTQVLEPLLKSDEQRRIPARSKYALQFAEEEFLAWAMENKVDGRYLGNMDLRVLSLMANEIRRHHESMEGFYMSLGLAQEDRRHGRYLTAQQAECEMETLEGVIIPEAIAVVRQAYHDDAAMLSASKLIEAAE